MFVVFLVLYILVYYPPCTVLRVYIYSIYTCVIVPMILMMMMQKTDKKELYRPSYKKLGPTTIDKEQTVTARSAHTQTETQNIIIISLRARLNIRIFIMIMRRGQINNLDHDQEIINKDDDELYIYFVLCDDVKSRAIFYNLFMEKSVCVLLIYYNWIKKRHTLLASYHR